MIALEMKDIVASEKYTLQAKPYVKEEEDWLLWREWYLQMSNLEEAKGNYKAALSYYHTCVEYADSVNNDEIQNSNLSLEAKYQTEKKQSQITQLEKEKQIQQLTFKQKTTQYYVLIGSLVAVILLVILGLRTSRQKQIVFPVLTLLFFCFE